jgi:hypothetical protein
MRRVLIYATLLSLSTACDGRAILTFDGWVLGDPGAEEQWIDPAEYPADIAPNLECKTPIPGPSPMRRLSHVEYRYILEDLFGDAALAKTASATLVSDPVSLGFSNSASLLDVKPVLAQQYLEAAEKAAETATTNLPALLACDVAARGEDVCATEFTARFLRRIYRRPVTEEEAAAYDVGYQRTRLNYGFRSGIEWIISTALQAPQFLYREESNAGEAPGIRPVRPYEMAARLAALIWHSIPDEELLTAAGENRLSTREDVEREVRRMLVDARAKRVLNFFEEWLDLDKLGGLPRDATVFAGVPSTLAALFEDETRAFLKHTVFEGDARFESLLTADFTFVNAALAQHYGIAGSFGATTFTKATLPAARRGVWMQGGPLTSHDKENRTSIVKRGLRVRSAILCHNIPAPPDNVNLTLPPIDATASQSDRLAQHRTDPLCASCHNLMDPIGQVFENFDAVGRERSKDEGGRTITTGGELTMTLDVDGNVTDGTDMLRKLAGSAQVRGCFTTQLFRYAHGREEISSDECARKQAFEKFARSGYDMRELIVGVATSDAFRYREVTP